MANKETEQPIFVNRDLSIPSAEYKKWIGELTKRYKQSQVKAAIKVNEGMLRFYWSLGRDIMLMKAEAKWGTSVLKNLSLDLQHEFPHSKGLSYTNLKYARQWYAFYNSSQVNRQQLVGDLEMPEVFAYVPWGHHISIISKSESIEEAMFYIQKMVAKMTKGGLFSYLRAYLTNITPYKLFIRLFFVEKQKLVVHPHKNVQRVFFIYIGSFDTPSIQTHRRTNSSSTA